MNEREMKRQFEGRHPDMVVTVIPGAVTYWANTPVENPTGHEPGYAVWVSRRNANPSETVVKTQWYPSLQAAMLEADGYIYTLPGRDYASPTPDLLKRSVQSCLPHRIADAGWRCVEAINRKIEDTDAPWSVYLERSATEVVHGEGGNLAAALADALTMIGQGG